MNSGGVDVSLKIWFAMAAVATIAITFCIRFYFIKKNEARASHNAAGVVNEKGQVDQVSYHAGGFTGNGKVTAVGNTYNIYVAKEKKDV